MSHAFGGLAAGLVGTAEYFLGVGEDPSQLTGFRMTAIVGALIVTGEQRSTMSTVLGAIAVAASMTNIVSGFLITDRMLKMFKKQ